MNSGKKEMDLAKISQRLLTRQFELLELSNNALDSRKPVELDQSKVGRLSRMDAIQDQAMAQDSERRRTAELKRISSALERIKTGAYGYCVSCDEPILQARMDIDPATATCIACASKNRG